MAEVDRAIGQAAGARELDVVGAQHLQHLGAHQAHDQRHLEQRQRDCRQDQRLQPALGQQPRRPPAERHGVAPSERRQPAEIDGEHENQQDADQEARQAHADQRRRQQHVRQHAVPSQCRVDTHRNTCEQRQQRGRERQLQRRRQPLLDQRRDLAPLSQRLPEFPTRRVSYETRELNDERLVEPKLRAELRLFGSGRVLSDHEHDRVAGEVEQAERDERHHRHDDDRLQKAAEDEREHEG